MREAAELQKWQIEKIQRGIQQADAGEFATDEEVAAVFARFLEEEDGGSLSREAGEGRGGGSGPS